MNIIKALPFLRGNGGGQQLPTPTILAANIFDDQINLYWDDLDADNYIVERSTNSDYSGATQIYTGTATTYQDTGLTAGVTYYYRVKASSTGYSDSDWGTTNAQTISFVPEFWYEPSGLAYNTDNDYGVTSNSNITTIKSILGNANNGTGVGTPGLTISSRYYGYPFYNISGAIYFNLATEISVSGDFTVVLLVRTSASGTNRVVLGHQTLATNYLRWNNTTSFVFSLGGVVTSVTLSAAISVDKVHTVVLQRTAGICRVSQDGGSTWNSNVTPNNNTLLISRLFSNSSGGNNLSMDTVRLVLAQSALSQTQIDEVANYLKKPDYTPTVAANPTSLALPTGINWNAFSGGYLVNSSLDDVATGSFIRERVIVKGNFAYILVQYKNEAPTYMQDVLYVWDMVNNLITDPIILPSLANDTDVHNNGSVFDFDGRIYQSEQLHYTTLASGNNNINFRKFAKGYKIFTGYSSVPLTQGYAKTGSQANYQQFNYYDDTLFMFVQGWNNSGYAESIDVFRTTDNLNYFEKLRIASVASSSFWFYHYVPNNGTNAKSVIFLNYLDTAPAIDDYPYAFALTTTDGYTYSNIANTFSKDIRNGNLITAAELIANCVFTTAGADKDALVTSAITLSNGDVVGIATDGSDTGFDFFRISGTVTTKKTIDTTGRTILEKLVVASADMTFAIWQVSTNEFHVILYGVNGGNWTLEEFKTEDNGDTWSFVQVVNTDTTKKHQRVTINKASPYDSSVVIAATRMESATEGSLFIKKMT